MPNNVTPTTIRFLPAPSVSLSSLRTHKPAPAPLIKHTYAASMAALQSNAGIKPLHIAVLPWLAYGHLNPFLELSIRIAALGHHVSLLSTPSNIRRLSAAAPRFLSNNLHFVDLYLNKQQRKTVTAELDNESQIPDLLVEFDGLEDQVGLFLRNASPEVDWIMFDSAAWWAARAAAARQTHSVYISMLSAAYHGFLGPLRSGDFTKDKLVQKPSWVEFETSVKFHDHETEQFASSQLKHDVSGLSGVDRILLSVENADVIAVRGCMELEQEWIELLNKLNKKPVIPVGHFPMSIEINSDSGNDSSRIFEWLDKRKEKSVVYIAFGSEAVLPEEQLREFAKGLEMSELQFVWALRRPEMLPDGFEVRIKDRGIVCRGWVPQIKILSHSSVGGFVTHCGWNSLVEALQFGTALILLPLVNDEGINARFMADKKAGLEVPRNHDGFLEAHVVTKTLRLVMVEEEGRIYREKAKELGSVLGKRELQDQYVENFLRYLQSYKRRSSFF